MQLLLSGGIYELHLYLYQTVFSYTWCQFRKIRDMLESLRDLLVTEIHTDSEAVPVLCSGNAVERSDGLGVSAQVYY